MTTLSEKKSTDATKLTFESALEQLQASVKKLESGDLTLEQSLKEFEEGVRLTRVCQEYLTVAEQRVEVLMKGSAAGGQPELQPFSTGSKNSN